MAYLGKQPKILELLASYDVFGRRVDEWLSLDSVLTLGEIAEDTLLSLSEETLRNSDLVSDALALPKEQ